MKDNFTAVNVILDASGSMSSLTDDTIGNFNSFLKDQKDFPGEVAFTLCVFNTDYRLVHNFVNIDDVNDLNKKTYSPMGGTALLDAMGYTIDSVGAKLANMKEEDRPSKVITVIITDGHENSSNQFDIDQVRSMVEHQKNVYNWEFIFLGANIDAIEAGTSLGVSKNNSMNYTSSPAGTRDLYQSVSRNLRSFRAKSGPTKDNFFDVPLPEKEVK